MKGKPRSEQLEEEERKRRRRNTGKMRRKREEEDKEERRFKLKPSYHNTIQYVKIPYNISNKIQYLK